MTCPDCDATQEDIEFLGIHHEIVAEYRCRACENTWSEQ